MIFRAQSCGNLLVACKSGRTAPNNIESITPHSPARSAFNVYRKTLRTRMRARLESKEWDSDSAGTRTDLGSWKKEAGIFVERELDCAISTPTEELVASSEMASTAQYLCTIRDDLYLVGDALP